MNIDFIQTGGFAGMRISVNIETQELPLDQSRKLEKLVSEAGFFSLSPNITSPEPLPDRFEYQISVSSEGKSHSVTVSESVVPDRLRPLLDFLCKIAIDKKDR